MKKYIEAGIILLTILTLAGCSKSSSSTTTKPSLSGLSINQAPAFVAAGTTLSFKADVSVLTTSDGSQPSKVGLYWQVNTAQVDTLTKDVSMANPEFIYSADTLGTYIVYCYAFAGTDYYVSSANSTFQAIDPNSVLGGIRPGTQIVANGKTWTSRNISHPTLGLSYRNSPIMDSVVGRLFSWEEARKACPSGWHLPTVAEFETSFADEDGSINAGDLMVEAFFQDEPMWEYWPAVSITNKFGFNAIPVGYVDILDNFYTYEKYGEYAMWWTADQSGDTGTYLYIFDEYPKVKKGQGDKKTLAMSVRCVMD